MKIQTPLCTRIRALILSFFIICTAGLSCARKGKITEEEIVRAQKTWADGVVAIGESYSSGGDYRQAAHNHVDSLYAYQSGPVLFNPTKAADEQFRLTKEGAVSYFVGSEKNFPADKGFAFQPWKKVRFENAGIFLHGDYAVAMGNYFFTPQEGKEVKVEYTFGYIKGDDGKLKINLHHSSLPYTKK